MSLIYHLFASHLQVVGALRVVAAVLRLHMCESCVVIRVDI